MLNCIIYYYQLVETVRNYKIVCVCVQIAIASRRRESELSTRAHVSRRATLTGSIEPAAAVLGASRQFPNLVANLRRSHVTRYTRAHKSFGNCKTFISR